ncbi:MAG: hypothetical protein ABIR64_08330 [Candidatus Limnocylindrales bacterium]
MNTIEPSGAGPIASVGMGVGWEVGSGVATTVLGGRLGVPIGGATGAVACPQAAIRREISAVASI